MNNKRGMLCISIGAKDAEQLANKASLALSLGADLVELRLDMLDSVSIDELGHRLRSLVGRAILTVRSRAEGGSFDRSEDERIKLISGLASLSPYLLDVELDTLRNDSALRRSLPKSKIIVSWHDTKETPSSRILVHKAREAFRLGSLAKIVTTAKNYEDNTRILSLYRYKWKRKLVAFCMGERGISSRFVALAVGSPMMYCSLRGESVAPGQVPYESLRPIVGLV